jgi:inorganic pyrophosphatase
MTNNNIWHDISPGSQAPNLINVVVEIPKGSQNKYEYDKSNNIIKLDRVLYSPLHYPGDYGLIPQTLSDDGDPLDVLVLMTNPTYPGVLLEARPIALLKMKDTYETDDKIHCAAVNDPRFASYKNVTDVEEHILKEISHFFRSIRIWREKK